MKRMIILKIANFLLRRAGRPYVVVNKRGLHRHLVHWAWPARPQAFGEDTYAFRDGDWVRP